MVFKFLIGISAFMGQCKFINSVLCMSTFCKYFICPLLILVPCFVESSSFEAGNTTTEYSGGFFVDCKNFFELFDSIAVENVDVLLSVKVLPEIGSGLIIKYKPLDSKRSKDSDKRNSKPDSPGWA